MVVENFVNFWENIKKFFVHVGDVVLPFQQSFFFENPLDNFNREDLS